MEDQSIIVQYMLEDNKPLLVEVEQKFAPQGEVTLAQGLNVIDGGKIKEALQRVIPATKEILEQIKGLAPEEVEIQFGIKMAGEANAFIAKSSLEGNFSVKLKWSK